MLEITRQADYALRAVMETSRLTKGERLPTSTISERQNIPQPFLAKIISQLVVAGILETTRGAKGGVNLARSANSITMRQVIESIDGPITLNRCVHDKSFCTISDSCQIGFKFQEAQLMVTKFFDSVNFAELAYAPELPMVGSMVGVD